MWDICVTSKEKRVLQAQVFSGEETVVHNWLCFSATSLSALVCCPSCMLAMKCKDADNENMKSNNIKQFGSSKELCRKCNAWFLPAWHSLLFIRLKAVSRKNWRWICFQQSEDYAQTGWNPQKVRDHDVRRQSAFLSQSGSQLCWGELWKRAEICT